MFVNFHQTKRIFTFPFNFNRVFSRNGSAYFTRGECGRPAVGLGGQPAGAGPENPERFGLSENRFHQNNMKSFEIFVHFRFCTIEMT